MFDRYFPEKFEYMPDKKIFLARAGTRYSKIDDPAFLQKINELFLLALTEVKPVVYHETVPIEVLPEQAIPIVFKGVKRVTVFASTLGKDFDELVEDYSKKDVFSAFILDSWGSEAVEKLNESFDKLLRSRFKEGTMRFSPGYGNVDVRMNKYFVKDLLKVEEIEVLESGILIPRKSTVCMIGWYE
ncbi:methionine synthase [Pseudothermotoga thermarum]|uniref:Vitamin B12 dependent methionine synthase activation region n=1 Tax=Pseudothermotoga thermarum DSM 5069 TaxID=688269 RepID=F7YXI0_9THEM|nr:methionine synthase [Pseudothermotoga thermarum]AEH50621.1 Vitamin B12 dependent methionine synthase activation region [Pseudothermotoga thermarum DSM 5069]